MKTTIKTKTAGRILIDSKFIGDEAAKFNKDNYNKHKVRIRHNNHTLTFNYWGSIMNPEITTNEENIFALYCFLSDAVSGKMSFEDFCEEFGYDTDSRKAERTHKQCEAAEKKYNRVFEADIYDLLNELQEEYNC